MRNIPLFPNRPSGRSPSRFSGRSLLPAVAAVVLAASAAVSAAAAAEKVGISAAVRGDVAVRSAAASRVARSGEAMFLGDQIASRAQSGMQILLLDETTFTVGADCQLTIDTFVYDPGKGVGAVSATVGKGALRYVSGLVAKGNPEAIKLKTPSSTIGLRGTTAEVVVGQDAIALARLLGYDVSNADPATATLVVLRGPGPERTTTDRRGDVTVTNAGGSVDISKPGFASFIPSKNAAPLPPVRMTEEAERALQAALTRRAGAGAGGGGLLAGSGSPYQQSGQTWVEGRPFDTPHDLFDNGIGLPPSGIQGPCIAGGGGPPPGGSGGYLVGPSSFTYPPNYGSCDGPPIYE
jgi:hypothetical protein